VAWDGRIQCTVVYRMLWWQCMGLVEVVLSSYSRLRYRYGTSRPQRQGETGPEKQLQLNVGFTRVTCWILLEVPCFGEAVLSSNNKYAYVE
jgi:hypothetical protein